MRFIVVKGEANHNEASPTSFDPLPFFWWVSKGNQKEHRSHFVLGEGRVRKKRSHPSREFCSGELLQAGCAFPSAALFASAGGSGVKAGRTGSRAGVCSGFGLVVSWD